MASNFSSVSGLRGTSTANYGQPSEHSYAVDERLRRFRRDSEIQPRFHASPRCIFRGGARYIFRGGGVACLRLVPHEPIPESVVYDRKAAEVNLPSFAGCFGTLGAGPNPIW